MLNQELERNLLGQFNGTLDLVHGLNSGRPVGRGHIHRWRSRASPFIIRIQRGMDGMQGNAAAAEPVRYFADMLLAVGVVKMLTGAKNLDRLRPSADQAVQ